MKIGVIVFAYNRSYHLSRTLEALRKNTGLDKIYIFQDGLKVEEHRSEWEKTKEVIKNIDWCKVDYHLSEVNKGLRKSILDGVNYVFQENDAVVVLEDDCVTTPNFMTFMRQGLEKYKEQKQVYSVSGYAWPIKLKEKKKDAYFCGRISSWGWGTWKDRWNKLEINYEITKEMKDDLYISEQLALWGNDMEDILVGNVRGSMDSWAVFWGLSVIKQGGLCLNPYYSLVDNIGFDGTGVHCGNMEKEKAISMSEQNRKFDLPDEFIISEEVKREFPVLFGGVYHAKDNKQKPTAIVYGMGNYYKQNESRVGIQYNIRMYIDRSKNGYYAGKKIGKISDVRKEQYDVILLMIANLNEALILSRELHSRYGVPYEKIKLGQGIFEKDSSLLKGISENGKFILDINDYYFQAGSYDEYENVREVFRNNIYQYYINNTNKDIVFDIGGSIGDSTLHFLMKKNVEKVYMYEPFPDTYVAAKENLKDFLGTERLELNMYGISNRTEKREITYNPNMSCGQSTIVDVREKAKNTYKNLNLIHEAEEQVQTIEVRRASEVLESLVKMHTNKNLILKMDCEGEEYDIIMDLFESGLLQRFQFIMLEWHYQGKESLLRDLHEAGFSYWCSDKSADMGLIYAYK